MTARDTVWVFGYGSLMWRPGFDCLRRLRGTLFGFHRRLCIYSHQYRGTPERPGLVFGLDRGGCCHGMVFEVAAELWPETLAYLREREQLNQVYREIFKRVRVNDLDGSVMGGSVLALTFAVDRTHAQYAGELPQQEILRLARQGHGQFGTCEDYIRNTVQHLRALNIHDSRLEDLVSGLDGTRQAER